MHLETFRIIDCFGFRDSKEVNLRDASNLIYLLGKNSSGKSSFLTALRNLEVDMTPDKHPNFRNFNLRSNANPRLIAKYTVKPSELSVAGLLTDFQNRVSDRPAPDTSLTNSAAYKKQIALLVPKLQEIYTAFFAELGTVGAIWVIRNGSGDYSFSPRSDFKDWDTRMEEISAAIGTVFPNNQINAEGTMRQIRITHHMIENLLFRQFPDIVRFDATYRLNDSLPPRITEAVLEDTPQSPLLTAFVSFLGKDDVQRFLISDSYREQGRLLTAMQGKLDDLVAKVNRYNTSVSNTDLIRLVLHSRDGLQITVLTSDRESFYSQISDNTKFLFAYYLYHHAHRIREDILLFDEPNNGFHATAQEQLLIFLQALATDGNLVIVATHSEYLIDPDHLSGVRILGIDEHLNLVVNNHYYTQLRGKDHGDHLALRPVTDAIGLKYGSAKLSITDKVIVTEGITDMLYLRAFNMLLGYADRLHIAPARGADTILHVLPLLISQYMRFKLVVDAGTGSGNIKAKVMRQYCVADAYIWEVPIPPVSLVKKGSGIEDLFSKADFQKLIEALGTPIDPEFMTMSNSEYLKHQDTTPSSGPPKRLVAATFYEHVGDYKLVDFEAVTVDNYRAVLDFCHKDVWFGF